jgi:Cytochrome C oxidase, cbb3-type, subunit III
VATKVGLGAEAPPRILPVCGAVLALLLVLGGLAVAWLRRDVPETHADSVADFKYGSIGTDQRAGIPYWIWRVMPLVFPEYLPDRPGEGYARLGFIFEPGSADRPIGTSVRENPVARIGLNCAACHTGTVRDEPDAPAQIVYGMPAQGLNAEGYYRFLFAAARDPRFNSDVLLAAIRQVNPGFSWWEGLIYQYVAIPNARAELLATGDRLAWFDQRPPFGPGRFDSSNTYKAVLGESIDDTVGTVDLPSIWNQRPREGLQLDWDGNNTSVDERSRGGTLGSGSSPDTLDEAALQRVRDWIWDLQPPPFSRERLDAERARAGEPIYQAQCAACHALDGALVGRVTPLAEIGTDPERLNAFTPSVAQALNTSDPAHPYPWRKFSHFQKTDGYANQPLDGVWLRAPYLHNGSVPTLRDLLNPPDQRPTTFVRGYDVYDHANVGFVSSGPQAERVGWRYDTRARGNSNQGHTYGTQLSPADKDALLEYLKTL